MVYLDYAAATPLAPEVLDAMMPWLGERFGNPGSLHQLGQEARAAVDASRMTVADFLGCQPTEVFFTASGTESCNWALLGTIEKRLLTGQPAHLICSSIEHSAVLKTSQYLQQAYGIHESRIPVDQGGLVDLDALETLFEPETQLVSVMAVNNEIGTIEPLESVSERCKERGVLFHADACQATSYLPLNVDDLGVDLLTINGSKISGPKGIGVLYIREGTPISPWTFGGGQEFSMRAGTENVSAIVGLAKALEILDPETESQRVAELRDLLWDRVQSRLPDVELNGSLEHAAPHILNLHLPRQEAQTLVKKLDLAGFAVSVGSACAAGTIEPSHVILALGYDESRARSSLRVSLGRQTSLTDVEGFADQLAQLCS